MPFNHKGEFIRHNPNPVPGPRPGPISTGSSRVRITSSADRPAQRPPQRPHSDDDVFHNWILIGLGLWVVASIRRRFR